MQLGRLERPAFLLGLSMIVRVSKRVNKNGQDAEIFFLLKTKHSDFDGVVDALRDDGFLEGVRYNTRSLGGGRRVVTSENRETVFRATITNIREEKTEVVFENGDLLWPGIAA